MYDDKSADGIYAYGDHDEPYPTVNAPVQVVAIERCEPYGSPLSYDLRDTIETVGILIALFVQNYPVLLIPRKYAKKALTGVVTSNDATVNRAVASILPEWGKRRKGVNGHHRAAAAIALVAPGVWHASQTTEAYADGTRSKSDPQIIAQGSHRVPLSETEGWSRPISPC